MSALRSPAWADAWSSRSTPSWACCFTPRFWAYHSPRSGRAFCDRRFLGAVLILNFVLIPVVVLGLSRFVAQDQALLVGVLLVLLTPCVDYVIIAFSGLAGGARDRLLAATPLLILLQVLLLLCISG